MFKNQNLFDFIKELSKRDTKSLEAKTLKTQEEVGELAKVVLPYVGAFATNHRIVGKHRIVEEIADTMLCILSIAHEIDMIDSLEDMLIKKATVWANKQEAEIGLSFPIPYEFHVTVETDKIEEFKTVCKEIGVKSIVIDLQNNNGASLMRDVMTSSKHFGNNTTAYAEMSRIASELNENGFKVVRQKIETVPWHPAAPRRNDPNAKMPADCYFESHFGVILDKDTSMNDERLIEISKKFGLHKSRNIFKTYDSGEKILMLTCRSYEGTQEDFNEKVKSIQEEFSKVGFDIEKTIVEFSVYDTKIKHDNVWIS